MEFVFEQSPWELAISKLGRGDSISAMDCLQLLEDMSQEDAEEALLALEAQGITLNVSDLPKDSSGGETAVRLRFEQKLIQSGQLLKGLEENDPLRLYLEELAQVPCAGDVDLLAKRYADGEEAVAQQLVDFCLHVVVERACSMAGHGVLLLDLIQEGSLGLWQGVLQYTDGDFRSHIHWWIDQYLAKAVLVQAHSAGIGQKMRQGMEDYRDMDQRLLTDLGRNPTLEEIADAMHVTVEDASAYAAMLAQANARKQIEQSRVPKEQTADDEQAVENTAYFQTRQRIMEMLSTLTEREAKLLTLRFGLEGGLPMDPRQAGETLGMTVDEVVELETAALLKLRKQAD